MLKRPQTYRRKLASFGVSIGVCTGLGLAVAPVQADELAATMWPSEDSQTQMPSQAALQQAAMQPPPTQPTAAQPQASPQLASYQSATPGDDAGAPLEMKQSVVVDAPVIRLGDLFNQPISGGDTPVAQAPKPGQTISLDYRFLSQLARAYRLDVSPHSTIDRVLVARKAQLIKSDMVIAAVADAIAQRTQQQNSMDIAFDSGQLQFTLPTNVEATIGVQGLNFDPTTNRFVAILVVPANGPTLISQQVIGTAYVKTDVPVLKHLVSAGDTIQADDVEWISSRLDQLMPSTVTDSQQMIGRVAKRPLRPGQMLRLSDLSNEAAVQKNSLITIMVQSNQMSLTMRGKAIEDGAIGQSIRVMNTTSHKQLVGVVKDAATVVIPMPAAIAMN
ncbi:MAG: flagellar basal body P-ring formation chaperone FlgA [Dongiaceae bacterium]